MVDVDSADPRVYILVYGEDFTLEPEPRWAVKRIPPDNERYPLRGLPYRYERPHDPVALEDWEDTEVIVLDTQAWVWWTNDPNRLSETQRQAISSNEADTIGVSVISCWEIAKLCEYGRLELPVELSEWFDAALAYPGVSLLNLTPEIAIESTRLPGEFSPRPF